MTLETYKALAQAIVILMDPLVEVVLHNLKTNTICFLAGTLSNRKIGDASLLDLENPEPQLGQVTYPKLNWDGRMIKSISVSIEKNFLMCINCDVSIFSQMQNLTTKLISTHCPQGPENLFKNDWQERLHQAIHRYLTEKNWKFGSLNTQQKKELTHHLFTQGAFSEKKAADYVAQTLGMSRATIFNHLRIWRTS